MRSVKSDPKPTVAAIPPFRTTLAELSSELGLLSVSGELDLYVAQELRESLATAQGLPRLVVDLSGASFLDSTICGVLVGEAKRRSGTGELVLVKNGSVATRVLDVAGLDRFIRIFPTLQGALDELLVKAS